MSERLMLLPGRAPARSRLLHIPADLDPRDALRHATAIIAEVQERNPGCGWGDLRSALEDQGFEEVDYVLGPGLD